MVREVSRPFYYHILCQIERFNEKIAQSHRWALLSTDKSASATDSLLKSERMGSLPWEKLKGKQRVRSEFEYLMQQIARQYLPQVHNLKMVGDSLWTFQLKNFDEGLQGGINLNKDLQELKEQYGQDHLLMEATFPNTYPSKPLFLRLVSPRCEMHTGHVCFEHFPFLPCVAI